MGAADVTAAGKVAADGGSCALCGKGLGPGGGSREHLIPNAIGGRKKVRGFLCDRCNGKAGEDWDDELARQLSAICNLLNITRDRGRPRDLVVETVGGRRLRRRSDGRMTPDRYEISERRDGETTVVHATAPSLRELKRHLNGLVRKYPQLKNVDLLEHAVLTKEYVNEPIHIPLTFGGLDAGRSVVKSCVTAAHMAGVRLSDLECASEYLSGKDEPCFGYYNETDVVLNRPPETFFHCVHVQGDREAGKVLGYVEYFGYQRLVVMLSDAYSGHAFAECYAIDPVTGRELALDVRIPNFSTDEVRQIYEYEKVSYETVRVALGRLVESYVEAAAKQAREEAIEDALEYAFENWGVHAGEVIQKQDTERLVALMVERLEPFLVNQILGWRGNDDGEIGS